MVGRTAKRRWTVGFASLVLLAGVLATVALVARSITPDPGPGDEQPSSTDPGSDPDEEPANHSPGDDRTPTPAPDGDEQVVDWRDCPFPQPEAVTVDCGWLTVPESRTTTTGRTVDLAVAVLRSPHPDPAPDPVLWLEGGPGGAAIAHHEDWLTPELHPILDQRDLILVDQRGTGYSEPSLFCDELLEPLDETSEGDTALADCHDRLRADGIDLHAYATHEIAADVADLRRALWVEEWNLLGSSYGTRVALAVLRDHPDGVRSVVLDAVYPLDVAALEEQVPNAAAAFTRLFTACDDDPDCQDAFGNLEQSLAETVERLNADPAIVPRDDPDGDSIDLLGDDLVWSLFSAMYTSQAIPTLPLAVHTAAEGDVIAALDLLEEVAAEEIPGSAARRSAVTEPRVADDSDGLFHSVECREQAAVTDLERVLDASTGVAEPLRAALLSDVVVMLGVCATWESGSAEPWEREPAHSDVPALLLAGDFDPVTPAAWAHRAGQTLAGATVVELPGTAHGALSEGSCPDRLVTAFLADPAAPADLNCVNDLDDPVFVLPAPPDPEE